MTTNQLIVDKQLAADMGVDNAIFLFPGIGCQPSWSIPNDKFLELTYAIVQLKYKLASLFAVEVYSKMLPNADIYAREILFHAEGNGIVFLLCDRLFRLNRCVADIGLNNLEIPTFSSKLKRPKSSHELQFHFIEADAIFNQQILSKLIPSRAKSGYIAPKLKALTILSGKTNYKVDSIAVANIKKILWLFPKIWGPISNIKHDIVVRKIPIKKALEKSILQLYLGILKKYGWRIYKLFPCRFIASTGVAIADVSDRFSWFWPIGYLGLLPDTLQCVLAKHERQLTIDDSVAKDVGDLFKEFFVNLKEDIHLPDETFETIPKIMEQLFSEHYSSQLASNFESALEILKKSGSRSYLAHTLVGAEPNPFYAAAARQLGLLNITHQHSAWGGYLAGGALVTELLTCGADYYLTFGWNNSEYPLSSAKYGFLNFPSPLLSKLNRAAKDLKFGRRSRRVLLPTGFLFRFPMIYNSALRLDVLNEWGDLIRCLISQLTDAGFTVDIKMYNEITAEVWRELFDSWIAAGKGKAIDFIKHDTSVREMIRTGVIADQYDAIVWDVPTGGLTESFASKVPTFGLWSDSIFKCTPSAISIIENMKAKGILGNSGQEIATSIDRFYNNGEFRNEYYATTMNFLDNFCKVDYDWYNSWQNGFSKIADGSFKSAENV